MRRLAAFFIALSAWACLAAPLDTPVLPKDAAAPLTLLAERSWQFPLPKSKTPGVEDELVVATYVPDRSKGPATLLVDLAGASGNPRTLEADVQVDVRCDNKPDNCVLDLDRSRLPFRGPYMAHGEAAGGRTFVAGREWRRYPFPDGMGNVRVSIRVPSNADFQPQQVRAWLFYGEHDGGRLAGQGTRTGQLLWTVGAAAIALAAAWAWLRRR